MPTIRHALGLVEQPGRTALETLSERLAGRDVLLVLDNFEQISDCGLIDRDAARGAPRS